MNYRQAVTNILQKTYDEHGINGQPWGYDVDGGICSYAAGCAIGVSLTPAFAAYWDERELPIGEMLEKSPQARTELFGFDAPIPFWVVDCLATLQARHDAQAERSLDPEEERAARAEYREEVTALARKYELELEEKYAHH